MTRIVVTKLKMSRKSPSGEFPPVNLPYVYPLFKFSTGELPPYEFSLILELLPKMFLISLPGVVACTYNPATSETEFRNGVGSIPLGGNSPSIGR